MEQPTERRIQTVCLVVIAAVLGATALHWLQPVMIPFVLALLLTYSLAPIVDWLILKLRLPRALAVLVAISLGFLLFSGLAGMVSSSVRTLAANADTYQGRLVDLGGQVSSTIASLGLDIGADNIEAQIRDLPVGAYITQAANVVVNTLSNTFLILIFAIYLLQGSTTRAGAANGMRSQIEGRIKRYLLIKVALSGLTGVLVTALLAMLGVDLALVFGVLAFILNFIPSVGSIIATLLPLPVALVDPDATATTLLLVLLLPGTVQIAIGNIIEPKLLGESLELHPITILLALIFWGMLWGIPGMLLATPITAALRIVFGHLDLTRPVARLMSGHLSEEVTAPDSSTPV